ncbi:hypothetical protein H5410_058328 [Solanum commersonii]|uniref:Reverse transcriptase domain-containing protein n=1 Tax=Solanum commersonii TaxID=4109 RepID=A0A9J5WRC4_SOLCO|nr:hypothetical protein H5410_058328 [Solanum commersonii]
MSIDLEKAYDTVSRDVLLGLLEAKCISVAYIRAIKTCIMESRLKLELWEDTSKRSSTFQLTWGYTKDHFLACSYFSK